MAVLGALAACAMAVAPQRATADDAALAGAIAKRAGFSRGVVAVLGTDGDVAIELARKTQWLVHVREPDAQAVGALRTAADDAGFDIQRLLIQRGKLDRLPHAANMLDLAISTDAGDLIKRLALAEVLRALRPEGAAIFLARHADADAPVVNELKQWAAKSDAANIKTWADDHGVWLQFTKPEATGVDEWTHWEKSPDNNPVSTDAQIKAPYMTQFMAEPYYIGMPAVTTAAGGRTFLAIGQIAHHLREWNMLNRIIARNGYNGVVLWQRDLPEGYVVHRSAFIATKDTFFMINGDHALMLDAATGEERGKVTIDGVEGEWKWIAMKDGVLYVLAGKPEKGVETVRGDREFGGWSWGDLSKDYYGKKVPHGYGDIVAAYNIADKKTVWQHKEQTLIDSRGLAIRDKHFYLYCPDKHLRALDLSNGQEAWTNQSPDTLGLIEEPGKGLTSTPGWRTQTLTVATPEALIIQGQTRMNVVAVSSKTGRLLWTKEKITNNPNAIYIDGKIVLGVGPNGSHVAIDPVTGDVEQNLKFFKRACTRLTASTDSLFCRGEGMTRFDRDSNTLMIDGAVRPACNDGVIPAHGLLYLGPWACDCNLSLIGNVARTSAGDFKFDFTATTAARLERAGNGDAINKTLDITDNDWPTYRRDNHRSGGSPVAAPRQVRQQWQFEPQRAYTPTAPVAAGGLIFIAGEDGKVRALDAATGELKWQFATGGIIKHPPTIANHRAYIGSGDGYVYCLEAATGRELWRFAAAPADRTIMIYGALSSTWPVASGVLVHKGVAFFAAGIVDHDGTYIYALDAETGEIKWQNNASGHLNQTLRKGVSVQGNLTVMGDKLILAGGNVVSPAIYSLADGRCLSQPRPQGQPQSNGGRFVGVFSDNTIIAGGRILYSSPRNVSTKGWFEVHAAGGRAQQLHYGGIAPAWDDKTFAMVNMKYGRIIAADADKLAKAATEPPGQNDRAGRFRNIATGLTSKNESRWEAGGDRASKFEAISLLVTPNAVIAVAQFQDAIRAHPQWFLTAYDAKTGNPTFRQPLPAEPLPGGLLIHRDGRIVVVMLEGGAVGYAGVDRN